MFKQIAIAVYLQALYQRADRPANREWVINNSSSLADRFFHR